jgi:hypothetical protein
MAELYGKSASTKLTPSTEEPASTTDEKRTGRFNRDFDDAVFAGKLVEVELDEDTAPKATSSTKKTPRKRTGLGPDGKPWRSRTERRNSADLHRDQLVDQVLREADMQCKSRSHPCVHHRTKNQRTDTFL